jgi:hypothetical protein
VDLCAGATERRLTGWQEEGQKKQRDRTGRKGLIRRKGLVSGEGAVRIEQSSLNFYV